ncbi:membrane magnesium transporter-domain-containing protein [Spinellus fusiger]|nr:membrane magnesium transporter-domain-containing protein [Spinellus fusiger]
MSTSQKIGKLIGLIGALFLAHAAYSTYDHLAYLKAVDQTATDIPVEVVAECLISALVSLLGVILSVEPFKNILMEVEIAKQTIDKMDTRPSFITFDHRKVKSTHATLERRFK